MGPGDRETVSSGPGHFSSGTKSPEREPHLAGTAPPFWNEDWCLASPLTWEGLFLTGGQCTPMGLQEGL